METGVAVAVMNSLVEVDRLLTRERMAVKAARRWSKSRPDRAHAASMEANDCSNKVDSERSYLTMLVGWTKANELFLATVESSGYATGVRW